MADLKFEDLGRELSQYLGHREPIFKSNKEKTM
jgi:hypothetical protein